MARLNLTIDDKLLERFREAANKKFSYKKGAIKKAVEEAVKMWLNVEEALQDEKLRPVETEGSL